MKSAAQLSESLRPQVGALTVRGGGQVPVAALLCGLVRCLEDGSVKAEMVQVRVGCARALPARR